MTTQRIPQVGQTVRYTEVGVGGSTYTVKVTELDERHGDPVFYGVVLDGDRVGDEIWANFDQINH